MKKLTFKEVHVRESLAEYAHATWSGWMEYLFNKSKENDDGTVTIPKWAVDRWKRQKSLAYKLLSEEEKESDRDEADRMLEIISPLLIRTLLFHKKVNNEKER